MFGISEIRPADRTVTMVRLIMIGLYVPLALGLLIFVLAALMLAPPPAKIFAVLSFMSFSGFSYSFFIGGRHWAKGLVSWWRKPSKRQIVADNAAWMAEFEPAFTLEYPKWQEFTALGRRGSPKFLALKNSFEANWLAYKPTELQREWPRFSLSREALMTVIGFKHNNAEPRGFAMHKLYRDWEVAVDGLRMHRPLRKA